MNIGRIGRELDVDAATGPVRGHRTPIAPDRQHNVHYVAYLGAVGYRRRQVSVDSRRSPLPPKPPARTGLLDLVLHLAIVAAVVIVLAIALALGLGLVIITARWAWDAGASPH